MDIVQKNATQYIFMYLPGVSSDVSNEFVLLFFGLFVLFMTGAVLLSLRDTWRWISNGKIEFHSYRLIILSLPIFIISLIFLGHHLTGIPDIHRSVGLFADFAVSPNLFKEIIVLWIILLFIEACGHMSFRRISKGFAILMGSLSPLIFNIMIMISHHAIRIPSIIH